MWGNNMVVDISKITLDNIHLYEKIGTIRKGQHLTDKEKAFFKSLEKPKEKTAYRKTLPRIILTEEEKIQHKKEYQHQYYLQVTKPKRQERRTKSK